MYDDLTATLNGMDVLPQMQLKDATLMLARELQPNEALDFKISFKSRAYPLVFSGERGARDSRFPADAHATGFAEGQAELSRRLHDSDGHPINHQRPGLRADFPSGPRHLKIRAWASRCRPCRSRVK